jgi:nitrite reductase/ring-hydroxylating ferredoxin subunit
MEKKMTWHKVADMEAALPWQDNDMCVVQAGDKKVTIARHNNELCSFAYKCPHASGILADGHINAAGLVTCPLHRYRFDIKNGRNPSGEGYYLKTYQTEKRDDGIYIGWEKTGLASIW